MHILMTITDLGTGGAQRVFTHIANGFQNRGVKVSVATFERGNTKPSFQLNDSIEVQRLDQHARSENVLQAVFNNVKRVKRLRATMAHSNPDVVISFGDQHNILSIIAAKMTGVPILVSERVDPSRHLIGKVWDKLRQMTYRHASDVIVQTKHVAEIISTNCRCQCTVIPNPIPRAITNPKGFGIITVGRLSYQKRQEDLILAFAHLGDDVEGRVLTIVGAGERRKELEALAKKLDVSDRTVFTGKLDDVTSALSNADIFVLPSRYEGFPNALCEAMACGLACVSYDCDSGPAEIIEHRKNGLLVPDGDVDALTDTMRELIRDDALREAIATEAVKVTQRYSVDAILDQWTSCIEKAMRKH